MVRWRIRELSGGLAIALGVISACGGQSTSADGDSGSGAGGSSGTMPNGGTGGVAGTTEAGGTGGTAGTTTTGGTAGTATTGGTAGIIITGGTAGTIITGGTGGSEPIGGTGGSSGGRPCLYGGELVEDGSHFTAADGCNTCTCFDGLLSCTLIGCPPPGDCDELSAMFQQALELAKTCNPTFEFQCQVPMASALRCGCRTYTNDPAGIDQLGQISLAWNRAACSGPITCGACPPEPIGAYCSSDGICVDTFGE